MPSTESLVELVHLGAYAVGSVLFTAGGLFVERAASADLLAGDVGFAMWEAAFGLLLLYAGLYVFGYRGLWSGLCARMN